jgi:glucose/arabinose dehydrogenase
MWPLILLALVPSPGFEQTQMTNELAYGTGFVRPLDGTDRFFVAQKSGEIRVVENGVVLPMPLATITPVLNDRECGLVGIALDPDFATNHLIYVFVTVSATEQQILVLKEENNVGSAPVPLVTGLPTRGIQHNGGAIGFGPDGHLYWAIGDNGNGLGVDADLASFGSKVSRARRDGTAPEDNPFFDGDGPNNDFVWARGFRNPFTLTFEPGRGRLWLNVVGTRYEQIFVVAAGDHAGWNNYENTQPAGYITPAIKYKTHGSDIRTITAAARANGSLQITTLEAHGFRRGEKITLAGLSGFEGELYVGAVTSTTTFTASQAGPDASSSASGGTATTLDTGAAVVGGVFYDGTDFPPEYWGNFFWTDYSSDRLLRATLDENGDVATYDYFGSAFNAAIDMEVGFDGALYLLTHLPWRIYRISATQDAQKLIVSNRHLRLAEGGRAALGIRLALVPEAEVTVTITAEAAGDPDVIVEHNTTLTFTPENYAVPQPVMFGAALDFDTSDDQTTFVIDSAGLPAQTITIDVTDHNAQTLLLSETALEVNEGSDATFTIALAEPPQMELVVRVMSPLAGLRISEDLTFSAANYDLPQPVVLSALEDDDALPATVRLMISAEGTAPRIIDVTIRDNDTVAPSFLSTPVLTAIAGALYEYPIQIAGTPPPELSFDIFPAGSALDPATKILSWLPLEPGNFQVVLRAANGIEPDAIQQFTIEVLADAPPSVSIVKPADGAVLEGAMHEWYATTTDDRGTVRAEFFIDGVLADTQVAAADRYVYKGSLDLAPGEHRLAVVAHDAKGQNARHEIGVEVPIETPAASEGCSCSATHAKPAKLRSKWSPRDRAPLVLPSTRDRL